MNNLIESTNRIADSPVSRPGIPLLLKSKLQASPLTQR
jgi:hypothetical protein